MNSKQDISTFKCEGDWRLQAAAGGWRLRLVAGGCGWSVGGCLP
jgi:hypothetical protein